MQDHPEIEYIVIDGASTDNTLEVVKEHGKRVSILVSEEDEGIYDAMNKGLALATGDVIGFINADDFYASADAITVVAAAFERSGVDACYADLIYVSQHDVNRTVRYWISCPFGQGLFERGWCPPHPTFFVKRAVYQSLGGFDLKYEIAADVDLMARFMVGAAISSLYIPKLLVKMRTGGTTNRSLANILTQNKEILHSLRALGLRTPILPFLLHKAFSRALQYLRRPS